MMIERRWVTLATIFLMLCGILAGCVQGPWSLSPGEKEIAGGAVFSLKHKAPEDSGKVHVAFVALDTTLCYAGGRQEDYFPAKEDFMMRMRWGHCNGETNTDSTSVRYFGGTKDIMEHKEEKEPVTYGDLFLVTEQHHLPPRADVAGSGRLATSQPTGSASFYSG